MIEQDMRKDTNLKDFKAPIHPVWSGRAGIFLTSRQESIWTEWSSFNEGSTLSYESDIYLSIILSIAHSGCFSKFKCCCFCEQETQGPCLMLLAFYRMVLAAHDLRATLSYGIFGCSVRLSGVLESPLSEAYLLSHSACFIDGSFR
jgi:hypothetical protein